MTIEKIKKKLHAAGYKLTPQREATIRILINHENEHMCADDVYMRLKEIAPDIGIATVYRTLELFSETKIVNKVNFGDGVARYDLRGDKEGHCHSHIVCNKCGSVEEIQEDFLESVEESIRKTYDFNVLDHSLMFHGICKKCK